MNDAIRNPPPVLQTMMLGYNRTTRQGDQRHRRAFLLFQNLSWSPFVYSGLQDLAEIWTIRYAEDGRKWRMSSTF
jgi:hypothetical protein